MHSNGLQETLDERLYALGVEVGLETLVQQIEVKDLFRAADESGVQDAFVESAVVSVGAVVLCGTDLLQEHERLDGGVEVGGVGDSQQSVDLSFESRIAGICEGECTVDTSQNLCHKFVVELLVGLFGLLLCSALLGGCFSCLSATTLLRTVGLAISFEFGCNSLRWLEKLNEKTKVDVEKAVRDALLFLGTSNLQVDLGPLWCTSCLFKEDLGSFK